MDSAGGGRWIAHGRPRAKAAHRLFCFPCAGGGASSYRRWSEFFGEDVEICPVQLPGRETRLEEACITDLHELTEEIGRGLEPLLDRPFSLFGHSLGGLIAFELARDLRNHGVGPDFLFVAGTPAPHLPRTRPPLHQLPEADLRDYLIALDGTPKAVLDQEWLLEMHLPILRADMGLLETYVYGRDAALPCPIGAFFGLSDPQVSADEVGAWQEHTSATFEAHGLTGTHFFPRESPEQLIALLRARIEEG